ncbi:MAG: type II secretion system major pseudopilin GspG [Proteobacteria bacterium]|nr:type II secretion system major pseudopilin GspG [Pseudomonadota bacterium]MBU1716634.1 type II secretion system major pseudopilin GspG [Pseudomonadota bacterium]
MDNLGILIPQGHPKGSVQSPLERDTSSGAHKFRLSRLATQLSFKNQKGFSLIEIMVVMIIIGLLASLVGPKLFGQLGKAKTKTAKAQIGMLMTSLDAYRLDVGEYPTEQQGLEALVSSTGSDDWDGPYIPKLPLDPWNHPYIYQNPGSNGEVDLYSYGKDISPGGDGEDADITSWE